jgi:hypothetical protein
MWCGPQVERFAMKLGSLVNICWISPLLKLL